VLIVKVAVPPGLMLDGETVTLGVSAGIRVREIPTGADRRISL
jgi:hypothetical protein